jgi:hypothetical protein
MDGDDAQTWTGDSDDGENASGPHPLVPADALSRSPTALVDGRTLSADMTW